LEAYGKIVDQSRSRKERMAQNGAVVGAAAPLPNNKAEGATLTGKQEHCMYTIPFSTSPPVKGLLHEIP